MEHHSPVINNVWPCCRERLRKGFTELRQLYLTHVLIHFFHSERLAVLQENSALSGVVRSKDNKDEYYCMVLRKLDVHLVSVS